MEITRLEKNRRMSQAVRHGDTIYLAGQVADETIPDAKVQTEGTLAKIDKLLQQMGSGKEKLLSATIYLADIRYYDQMNAAWDAWIDPENTPARATVEAKLATPDYWVEIMVIAAA